MHHALQGYMADLPRDRSACKALDDTPCAKHPLLTVQWRSSTTGLPSQIKDP